MRSTPQLCNSLSVGRMITKKVIAVSSGSSTMVVTDPEIKGSSLDAAQVQKGGFKNDFIFKLKKSFLVNSILA